MCQPYSTSTRDTSLIEGQLKGIFHLSQTFIPLGQSCYMQKGQKNVKKGRERRSKKYHIKWDNNYTKNEVAPNLIWSSFYIHLHPHTFHQHLISSITRLLKLVSKK